MIIHNDSLPAPSVATQPERKEILTAPIRQETATQATSAVDTNISQVTPLLGTTLRENTQLQNTNTQEDFEEILGTRVFQRYVEMPIQILDGIIVNQPKRFLPLAQEARKITEEIRIKKINEQWAGILWEQLLNQSFNDQLNSIQILEQLAPLQLTKDHLPGDIIDILERLGKADNIPHNQLYYVAKNCVDHYYSKVIETFVLLLKKQFANRQLLLINTTRSLKFLEEYAYRQALIWKIFSKHQNIPDDISNLHLHIDDFKSNVQKEFNFLKEATRRNIDNFQASLSSQQTYSVPLGSHKNNIYHKISEIQQQLPHPTQHMNTGDIIQIDTPEFDPDIDIEGQFEDIQTYLDHHNTYQESWNIRKEYTKRLLDLDDERYYRDIDRMYKTYPRDQAYIPVVQTPIPCRMTQELMQTYGRGRGQAHRKELHGHQPFGAHT